jgi:hypothetical protein
MEQFRNDKNYLEAAKVAFDGNYTQLFMQVLAEMLGGYDESRKIEIDEEGSIIE